AGAVLGLAALLVVWPLAALWTIAKVGRAVGRSIAGQTVSSRDSPPKTPEDTPHSDPGRRLRQCLWAALLVLFLGGFVQVLCFAICIGGSWCGNYRAPFTALPLWLVALILAEGLQAVGLAL